MSYIGTEPKDIRSFGRTQFDYTATQGQTAFTGADDDGKVLAFTTGQINVYVNGILMDDSDFTTTGTGTVTLASAANLNDIISIVSFESNIPDNDYVPASGGTFTGAVTHSGNVTFSGTTSGIDMNGTELVLDADGDTGITADTDDRIDFKIAGSDRGNLHYDGNDFFSLESNDYLTLVQNQTAERAVILGPTYFKPYNAHDNTLDLGISAARWKDLHLSGSAYLGGGTYIGGNTAANKLEDYEEGTWTPTVGAVTGLTQPTVTAGTFGGSYTKIGSLVQASFYIGPFQFNSTGQSSTLAIKGFPFNGDPNKQSTAGPANAYYYITWARPGFVSMRHYTANEFGFLSSNNGGNWGWEACSAAGTGASRYIIGSITYFTAS